MRLVADIHAHDLAHDAVDARISCSAPSVGMMERSTATSSSEKPFGASRREGETVPHAVREHDRNCDVMRVAGGFQRRDDVIGVVGELGRARKRPIG